MAALIGSTPSEVRALGIRDLGSGLLLVAASDARLPIALRIGFDLSDAARYGRGRPAVLAMTLGLRGLGVAGLLRAGGCRRSRAAPRCAAPARPAGIAVVCVNGGTGNAEARRLERVDRVARPAPGARAPGARVPRGALPGEVVEAPRHVHRGRPRGARRGRRARPVRRALMLGFSMGGRRLDRGRGPPGGDARSWASPRGSPSACPWRACAAGASPSSRAPSTAGCPAFPASARSSSRAGYERVRALGVDAGYQLIRGAIHPIALRGPRRAPACPRPGPAPGPGWWATS